MMHHAMTSRRSFVGVECLTAVAAVLFMLPKTAPAQVDMSDFVPEVELRRIAEMPDGFAKVQRCFYLGELSSHSGRARAAREAYMLAMVTYDNVSGNHRTLAVTYAAQAALGLAGVTHLDFRAAPLRWASYPTDSARRWDLLVQARQEYALVTTLGYARATFEALYLRARLFEEWDAGRLDTLAERDDGVPPIVRAIRHLNTAVQMNEQAEEEYRRVMSLADTLGLANGSGDDDVSEWTGAARERLEALEPERRLLVAREEALQAIYAERQSARWAERATPLLWERGRALAERDAGVAEPFFDYYIQVRLTEGAYRPFMFGPDGFYTSHRQSVESAREVRSEHWVNERLRWQRRQEWLDTDISRRLAREGLAQLRRVPASLDTMVTRLAAVADSLPDEVRTVLMRLRPPPTIEMPDIPDWGGRDPRMMGREEETEAVDEYYRYREQIQEVESQIEAYRGIVLNFGRQVGALTSEEQPPELVRYNQRREGLRAAEVLLLDTLGTMVLDQAARALEQSRAAAVWVPPGPQSVAGQQAINDYMGAVAGDLRSLAALSRSEAERYRKAAENLKRRPPAYEMDTLSGRLREFARRMEDAAERFSTGAPGS